MYFRYITYILTYLLKGLLTVHYLYFYWGIWISSAPRAHSSSSPRRPWGRGVLSSLKLYREAINTDTRFICVRTCIPPPDPMYSASYHAGNDSNANFADIHLMYTLGYTPHLVHTHDMKMCNQSLCYIYQHAPLLQMHCNMNIIHHWRSSPVSISFRNWNMQKGTKMSSFFCEPFSPKPKLPPLSALPSTILPATPPVPHTPRHSATNLLRAPRTTHSVHDTQWVIITLRTPPITIVVFALKSLYRLYNVLTVKNVPMRRFWQSVIIAKHSHTTSHLVEFQTSASGIVSHRVTIIETQSQLKKKLGKIIFCMHCTLPL